VTGGLVPEAGTPLTEAGLTAHAASLDVPLTVVWSVIEVETSGCGFLANRRPTILFERHVFRRQTGGQFDAKHPDLSNATAGGYGPGGANQHDRLKRAIALNRKAALNSTSWGLGQIMGFNSSMAGFADVDAMVAAMERSEDDQLGGMLAFLRASDLHKPLKQKAWAKFAKGYNGPSFAKHDYDTKLAAAFARFSVQGLPDLRVRAAQVQLFYRGYRPGKIDGRFGNRTRDALLLFQADAKIPVSGKLDAASLSKLGV
jgi:hypothetical protein